MTKSSNLKFWMSGAFGAALVGLAGVAAAQGYDNGDYTNRTETIIVRPDRDYVQTRHLLGRVDGEINPEVISISRRVDISDLDLTQIADRDEMADRVHDTALDLCAEIDHRFGRTTAEDTRECVRTATRDALADVNSRTALR